MYRRLWITFLGMAVATGCLAGCGDGRTKMSLAKAGGTVTCNGKPVGHVTVYFLPLQSGKSALVGKWAMGYADEAGAFTLGTYDSADGAVIGKHQVRVGPPLAERPANFKCDCELSDVNVVQEVEVVEGPDNEFEIKLKLPDLKKPVGKLPPSAQNAEVDD